MYAIIETGGKQYRVETGSIIQVDLLTQEEGSTFETDKVLFIKRGENDYSIGAPYLEGVKVQGKLTAHIKGRKIIVFKKKRRKTYRRTQGHRQQYSTIEITGING